MLFNVFIAILSLAILAGCIIAIVMCTSHGTEWLQSRWESRNPPAAADRDGERTPD